MNRADRLSKLHGLYGIIDDGADFALPPADWARALAAGGASVIQLRFKRSPMGQALEQARQIRRDLPRILLLVNDRADLALLADADGVHVGAEDLPVPEARQLLGPDRLVGATVRNGEQALARLTEGADHLGAGPVFASATKQLASAMPFGVAGLRKICAAAAGAPVVAISGIDESNVGAVAEAGARAVAVIGAVGRASNPERAARRLTLAFDRGVSE